MYIIKGIINNQEVYFVKLEIQQMFNTDFDVRICSKTIGGATKYKNIEEAEEECQRINEKSFKIYPICPKCNQEYYGYPSISRIDNRTKICDKCGLTEALTDFFEYEKKATNM